MKRLNGAVAIKQAGFREGGHRSPPKIRLYARRIGYDLEKHRSTRINQKFIDWADTILYMDGGNLERLLEYDNTEGKTLSLAGVIGLERLRDPNFIKEGKELDDNLDLLIVAAEKFAEIFMQSLLEDADPSVQDDQAQVLPEHIRLDDSGKPLDPYL